MDATATRTVHTPSFAFHQKHQWYWDEAIATLKAPIRVPSSGRLNIQGSHAAALNKGYCGELK